MGTYCRALKARAIGRSISGSIKVAPISSSCSAVFTCHQRSSGSGGQTHLADLRGFYLCRWDCRVEVSFQCSLEISLEAK